MAKDSSITFVITDDGVNWQWKKNKPDLTAEEATAIGVTKVAGSLNRIADAINNLAEAVREHKDISTED